MKWSFGNGKRHAAGSIGRSGRRSASRSGSGSARWRLRLCGPRPPAAGRSSAAPGPTGRPARALSRAPQSGRVRDRVRRAHPDSSRRPQRIKLQAHRARAAGGQRAHGREMTTRAGACPSAAATTRTAEVPARGLPPSRDHAPPPSTLRWLAVATESWIASLGFAGRRPPRPRPPSPSRRPPRRGSLPGPRRCRLPKGTAAIVLGWTCATGIRAGRRPCRARTAGGRSARSA